MLRRVQFDQRQGLALFHVGQYRVLALATGRLLHQGITIEADDSALGCQLIIAGTGGDDGGGVLRGRHLAGDELSPDQLIEPLCVPLHALEGGLGDIHIRRAYRLVGLLGPLLGGIGPG